MTDTATQAPARGTRLGRGIISRDYGTSQHPGATRDHACWRGTEAERTWEVFSGGLGQPNWYLIGAPAEDPRAQGMNTHETLPAGYRGWNVPATMITMLPEFTVGQRLYTREEIDALPVGTVVGPHAGDADVDPWTKQPSGLWHGQGRNEDGTHFALRGHCHIISLPDSVTELPAWAVVGYRLQSYEEFDQLPVGTRVGPDESEVYVKVAPRPDGDDWEFGGDYHGTGMFALGGFNHILSLPGRLTVGQRLETIEQLSAVPVGSTVRLRERHGRETTTWTRNEEGYLRADGTTRLVNTFRPTRYTYLLESLPGQQPVTPPTPTAPLQAGEVDELLDDYDEVTPIHPDEDTIERYRQRLAAVVMGLATASGEMRPDVSTALTKVGCPLETSGYTVARGWVIPTNLQTVIPEGTLLRGVSYNYRGIVQWRLGRPEQVLNSPVPQRNQPMRVVLVGGEDPVPEWRSATVEDLRQIQEVRRQIHTLGAEAKRAHRWCPTYEHSMEAASVTASLVGEALEPAQVAALPEGTVLRSVGIVDTCFYQRVDASTNEARTVRLSDNHTGHYAPLMMAVDPDRNWLTSWQEYLDLPLGAVVQDANGYEYEHAERGLWRRAGSTRRLQKAREMWTVCGSCRVVRFR